MYCVLGRAAKKRAICAEVFKKKAHSVLCVALSDVSVMHNACAVRIDNRTLKALLPPFHTWVHSVDCGKEGREKGHILVPMKVSTLKQPLA